MAEPSILERVNAILVHDGRGVVRHLEVHAVVKVRCVAAVPFVSGRRIGRIIPIRLPHLPGFAVRERQLPRCLDYCLASIPCECATLAYCQSSTPSS